MSTEPDEHRIPYDFVMHEILAEAERLRVRDKLVMELSSDPHHSSVYMMDTGDRQALVASGDRGVCTYEVSRRVVAPYLDAMMGVINRLDLCGVRAEMNSTNMHCEEHYGSH